MSNPSGANLQAEVRRWNERLGRFETITYENGIRVATPEPPPLNDISTIVRIFDEPKGQSINPPQRRGMDSYDKLDLGLPLMFAFGGALCFWIAVLIPTPQAPAVGFFSCAALTAIASVLGYMHFREKEAAQFERLCEKRIHEQAREAKP